MDVELEQATIQANGVRLYVVSAGPPEGDPIVLLHGFPEFWRGWIHQIDPLARAGFRVIVPDQRGYNLSEVPRAVRDYSLDRLSEDVVALLDHFGCARAGVVGHDWGAGVAWVTAIRFPDRVRRLGILNVPHPAVWKAFLRRSPAQMLRSWYVAFFQIPRLPDWLLRRNGFEAAARMLRASSKTSTFSDEDIAEYKHAWANSGGMTGMINWYRAALRCPPHLSSDTTLPMPVLILWGRHDVALSHEMAPASLRYCPQGKLITFEDATHWVQHDEPQAVAQALIDFMRPDGAPDAGGGGGS